MLLSKFGILKNIETSIPFSMVSREVSLRISINMQFKFLYLTENLIDSNVIAVKKSNQGQEFLFLTNDATAIPIENNTVSISSNDEIADASPVDSSDIDLNVISTSPKDSGNPKLNRSSSNHNYVTFYDDYIEYKHYVKDIMQNISSNKEIGKSFENENESQ